jgi:hypothetical protein
MPKFIKTLHDRVQFAIKKGLTDYVSPDKMMEEVHAESMNLWKKYIDAFEETQKLSMYLDPFRDEETVALSNGVGVFSNTDTYKIGYFTQAGRNIDSVPIAHWGYRSTSVLLPPNEDYPICLVERGAIKVLPVTLPSIIIKFLKKPIKPVYSFTISGDQYVYDDAASVDIEWSEVLHDEIMNRVLSNLGINFREGTLIQYSQSEKQQEGA